VPSLAHAKAVGEIRKRLNDSTGSVPWWPMCTQRHEDRPGSGRARRTSCASIQDLYVFDKPDPKRTEFTPEGSWRDRRAFRHARTAGEPAQEQDKGLRIASTTAPLAERIAVHLRRPRVWAWWRAPWVHPHTADRLDFHNIRVDEGPRGAGDAAGYRMMADRMGCRGLSTTPGTWAYRSS